MSAFRFPLQKVLELRKHQEQVAALRLAEAEREAERARRALDALEELRRQGHDRLAQAHGAGGLAGHLQNLRYVVDRLTQLVADADAMTRAADERVSAMLAELSVALRERRIMDRLRERSLAEWRLEQARAEQKLMDDVATERHERNAVLQVTEDPEP
ncbi:MAG: flagellar export protein FliJ [bacterium]|jgi:flagellar FliJ protein|nr:MAG: flagellar export protein FliJ [bacterium]